MMGWGYNTAWMMGGYQFIGIYNFITWTLFIAVLVALFRWLWKKGDKK